jgi:YidC/Oxa1 family membrane protein insertase
MENNKNLIFAILFSFVIIFLWQRFYVAPKIKAQQQLKLQEEQITKIETSTQSEPEITNLSREELLTSTKRIIINTSKINGSINLKGAKFDDITLKSYNKELNSTEKIQLLNPKNSQKDYFAEFGWVSNQKINIPDKNTIWKSKSNTLTPNSPAILTWRNNQGLTFKRTISIDENYLFSITDKITNNSSDIIELTNYGLINRIYKPETMAMYILHEGPLAVTNGELQEIKYKKLKKKQKIQFEDSQGWLGISDKYWLTAIIPDKKSNHNISFKAYQKNNNDKYQIDYIAKKEFIAPNSTFSTTNKLFVGAKEIQLLDKYSKEHDIELFDRAVDFGVLYFLTKPIFVALKTIFDFVGNFGIAIIILTIFIRLLLFPLANKSFKEMGKMRQLHPEILKIKEKCKDDKMRLNREIMALYQKHKVKPMAGCLPVLVQIPVFFALYKVIFITIDLRHANFFGWIHDLSIGDPTSIFNLFGLLPFNSIITIGIWPILMGISMIIQQKLNPPPADPMQAKMMKFLPYLFTFMLANFPAGLVIYWTVNNILSITQQYYITKTAPKLNTI